MLPGISLKFHLLCFSVFLLCLHYAPKLPKILSIVMGTDCSIRVFHNKVTVLLESINLRSYLSTFLQFKHFTDCSIREYRSIFRYIQLSILEHLPVMLALYQHNTLAYYAFYYAGILEAGLNITGQQFYYILQKSLLGYSYIAILL